MNWLIFRIATTYVGTVIGAGFASGQEIIQFFTKLGLSGFWGIGVAALLFAFFAFVILFLAKVFSSQSYGEFLLTLCGPKLGMLLDSFVSLFLLGGLCVMIAGGGAVFSEHLGLPYTVGILFTAFLVIVIVFFGLAGVMVANAFIVPVMVGATILVSFLAVREKGFALPQLHHPNWFLSALLYVSYNMTLAVGVLVPLGKNVRGEKQLYLGGIFGGILLGIMILANNLSLAVYYPTVTNYQIPMLYVAGHYGLPLHYLYILVLWLEMVSTAIGNAYGLAKKLEGIVSVGYRKIVLFLVVLILPCSYLGFANLVSWLYPLFGYLSLVFLSFLLVNFFKQGKRVF